MKASEMKMRQMSVYKLYAGMCRERAEQEHSPNCRAYPCMRPTFLWTKNQLNILVCGAKMTNTMYANVQEQEQNTDLTCRAYPRMRQSARFKSNLKATSDIFEGA